MSDELDARVRSLEAERLRPVPMRPSKPRRIRPEELAELCDALAHEHHRRTAAATRTEEYVFLREQGVPLEAAADQVGIKAKTARRDYEPKRSYPQIQ